MEVFLIRALQLILCLSLLVLLHEGGHFLFAKLFKVRVNKFSLFFDPWFSIAKFKPKNSDTTYNLGWLPLGGYVQIAGMVDETQDAEQLKQPVQPWEFRAKPAWQRLLIMLGGVLMNLIVAFVIYAGILFVWGETYVPIQNMTHGLKFNTTAQELGFRDGDIPIRTNETIFQRFDNNESFGNFYRSISNATSVTVLRHGKEVRLAMPGNLDMLEMLRSEPPFALPLAPAVVDSVAPETPAAKAGMRKGDRFMAYNGKPLATVNEYNDIRGQMDDILSAGNQSDSIQLRTAQVVVLHEGETIPDTLTMQLNADFLMGIVWASPFAEYATVTRHYSLLESIPAGFRHGWQVLKGYVTDLKYIFTKEGAQSVGSFGAIGSLFPKTWQWQRFWELTAFISLILAFMNILPIPALDGGHVFFLLFEVITRRKPSDNFMQRAETIGMALLLLLMALAIFNDFRNFVF